MSRASTAGVGVGAAALGDLRRTRQRRRLGETEWFDAAYRVYLAALFGGGGILWASAAIGNEPVGPATAAAIGRNLPSALGVVAALAVLVGLRSGAQGGPLALEAADVSMVMMSPVDRATALRRPAVQRLRSAVGMGVAAGVVAGQLAGRRLPGSPAAWAAAGALFGATVALIWIGGALCAHARRLAPPAATTIGLLAVGWQTAAVATRVPGVGDPVGRLALWGWRQHPFDLVGTAAGVGLTIAGLAMVGRTSLEALARRSSLVAQLRFAVTMQDLRTVILLRRQLNQERARTRPWISINGRRPTNTVVRRGLRGLARSPVTRLVRIAAISATLGGAIAGAGRGATALLLVAALAGFVLGLETMEPLSQEIDQPNHTDSFPIGRGWLLAHHLVAPLVLLIPASMIAAAAALAVAQRDDVIGAVLILALPTTLAAACGGVASIVRDAPDPFSSQTQQAFMPPEMAGFSTTMRLLWPLAISLGGAALPLFVRSAVMAGSGPVGAAVRGAVAQLLLVAVVVTWVRHRDVMRARFRQFMAEGRNYNPNKALPGGSP